MPTTREIRRRIRGVKSTAQITRAMEMVSASKMRRAQNMALSTRPFAEKMDEVLGHLAAVMAHTAQGDLPHPLLRRRERKTVGLVLITPDRGLAGGMVTNVIQRAAAFTLDQGAPTKVVAVGRKGRDWMNRHGGRVVSEFTQLGDRPALIDTLGISHAVMDGYCEGQYDEVYMLYCRFVSTLVQRPTVRRLLPIEPPQSSATHEIDYVYEPDPAGVLAELLPRYVEMEVYHAILESIASEESARMVAMRNATDNANDIIKDLTLTYNRARQAAITMEIAEIAAAEAVLK
jgi:F-type H+-transporting ATPase subunit gamma